MGKIYKLFRDNKKLILILFLVTVFMFALAVWSYVNELSPYSCVKRTL